MAQNLTEDEVKRLALLARLELTQDEVIQYVKELNNVLDYFTMLQDVDTEGLTLYGPHTDIALVVNAKKTVTPDIHGVHIMSIFQAPCGRFLFCH